MYWHSPVGLRGPVTRAHTWWNFPAVGVEEIRAGLVAISLEPLDAPQCEIADARAQQLSPFLVCQPRNADEVGYSRHHMDRGERETYLADLAVGIWDAFRRFLDGLRRRRMIPAEDPSHLRAFGNPRRQASGHRTLMPACAGTYTVNQECSE